VRSSGSRRNNTNDFLAIYLEEGMDHNKQRIRTDGANCEPAILPEGFVALCQGIRIIENEDCSLEANVVLEQVKPALVSVPFKAHRRQRTWD
jgi:hypothetical protein